MLVSLLLNVYFWVMNFGYASYALRMARGSSRATGGCLTALQPWAGLFWSVC